MLCDAPMAAPRLDIRAKPEDAFSADAAEPAQAPSPGVGSVEARRGSNRLWWALLAGFVLILGVAVLGAATRDEDRGIRGPADQGAPDAPRSEKVPPSAER
jgi:hypothetical protein